MKSVAVFSRVQDALTRLALASPTGTCLIAGDTRDASFFGLCAEHYAQVVKAGVPQPDEPGADGQCSVIGHSAPAAAGEAFCREHLAYFASMEGGALLRTLESSVQFPVQEIALSRIEPGSFAMRPDLTPENVADLARSMAKDGQILPILVVPRDGSYEIVYGHRRRLAALQIPGKRTIRAQVAPAGTPRERLLAFASAENFERQWVPPFGKSAWMAKLRDREEMTNEAIATAMNLSLREVERHFQVLSRTHDAVLDAYLAGRISLRTAVRISAVARDRQPELLRRALREQVAAQREAERLAREEARAAWLAWRRGGAGDDVTFHGGPRGRHKLCVWLPGAEEELRLFLAYFYPRLKRQR